MRSLAIRSMCGLLGILATGTMSSAWGADLPAPVLAAVAPVPDPTWGGLYVGANLGYGGNNFAYPYSVTNGGASLTTLNVTLTTSGILGGGQVGYNYALPHFGLPYDGGIVVGAEADYDGASIAVNAQLIGASPNGGGTAGGSVGGRLTSLGTARGRLGISFGRLLVFGTGGFAFGQTRDIGFVTIGGTAFPIGSSTFHPGKAYGGGVEFLVTNNISFKLEYLRANLDDKVISQGAAATRSYTLGEQPQANIVRGGINYRFDFSNPVPLVAAAY